MNVHVEAQMKGAQIGAEGPPYGSQIGQAVS